MAMFMGYCRFENTLIALRELLEDMGGDDDLSPAEEKARLRLIKLCARVAADYAEDEVAV